MLPEALEKQGCTVLAGVVAHDQAGVNPLVDRPALALSRSSRAQRRRNRG